MDYNPWSLEPIVNRSKPLPKNLVTAFANLGFTRKKNMMNLAYRGILRGPVVITSDEFLRRDIEDLRNNPRMLDVVFFDGDLVRLTLTYSGKHILLAILKEETHG